MHCECSLGKVLFQQAATQQQQKKGHNSFSDLRQLLFTSAQQLCQLCVVLACVMFICIQLALSLPMGQFIIGQRKSDNYKFWSHLMWPTNNNEQEETKIYMADICIYTYMIYMFACAATCAYNPRA